MLSRTENNALAFASTGESVLDLFFALAEPSPSFSGSDLRDKVISAARSSPKDTLKVIMHARDCRGGKGIRKQSLFALLTFIGACTHKRHVIRMAIDLLPEYGRFRDLIDMCSMLKSYDKECVHLPRELKTKSLTHVMREDVARAYLQQLTLDTESLAANGPAGSVSLAAKWITSENKKDMRVFYKGLAKRAFPGCSNSCERFRKEILRPLRTRIDMVESRMSDMDYASIRYHQVPSKAMSKYVKAFRKHDAARHGQYLESLRKGETSIKGGRLYPHEIVQQIQQEVSEDNDPVLEQLEHQWESMVKSTVDARSLGRTLVLSDVSSSMEGTPMFVSIALGILVSAFSVEPFRNKVITFSERPTFHEIPAEARLRDKIRCMERMPWGGNTDLMAVFRLILSQLVSNVPRVQDNSREGVSGTRCENVAPDTLVILSDMQFDEALNMRGGDSSSLTVFETARKMFRDAGFELPTVVFWNLRNSSKNAFPVSQNESGITLFSGPSPSLLNSLLSGVEISPMSILRDSVLQNARYDSVIYPDSLL